MTRARKTARRLLCGDHVSLHPTLRIASHLALLLLPAVAACALDGVEADDAVQAADGFQPPDPTRWSLVFKEHFDGQQLAAGWINEKGAVPGCVALNGGRLHVKARDRTTCEYYHDKVYGPTGRYIFAAKMKLPRTRGNFNSFWVRHAAGQIYNELDIVESFGEIDQPNNPCGDGDVTSTSGKGWFGMQNVFYSSAVPKVGRVHCFGKKQMASLTPYDDDFHVFSLDWQPGDHATFSMDGVETASFGAGAALAGAIQISLTNFFTPKVAAGEAEIRGPGSSDLVVEWVKVWQKKEASAPAGDDAAVPLDLARDDGAVLDPAFYLATYPDLQAAFGNDVEAARQHWLTYGILEGRVGSPTFDMGYYRAAHPDLAALDAMGLVDHFLEWGIQEGRVSSPFFDVASYVATYPDLAAAFGADHHAAIQHFHDFGIAEGRRGAPTFDPPWYLANNPDVAAAYGPTNYLGAIVHWQVYGQFEGRAGAPAP
jgi:hypothetical protein